MGKKAILLIIAVFLPAVMIRAQENEVFLKGIVMNSRGEPLAGASVTILNTFAGAATDASGAYIIGPLKPGTYTVQCSYLGYEKQSIVKEIGSAEAAADFIMEASALITGEVIVNATRAERNTPLAFTTVDGRQLADRNSGPDLPFLLSLTPSLVETSESGNGIGYTNLRIRGSDASRINVTIDGIPLNDAESQQVFWVDLPDIAASADNIQIQRGAGTSTNGAAAFGATISVQTKNPDNEPFAKISSSAGSFGTFKNSIETGTGTLAGKFALQLRVSDLKSKGYVYRTGSEHRSALITGIYRSGKSMLRANLILGEEKTGIGWWGVPREMLKTDRRYNPAGEYTDENGELKYYDNETDNYTQHHYQLTYAISLNKKMSMSTSLHYTLGKGYYEEFSEDAGFVSYGLENLIIGTSVMSETDLVRRKWMSNDFYGLVYTLKYAGTRFDLTAGGGINRYLGDHFGRIVWMKYAGTTAKDHQWYFNTGNKTDANLFMKMNYRISDKISAFGDIQLRTVAYTMTGYDDDFRDLGQSHKHTFLNPRAGLFWSVSPDQDLWVSFSTANREPTRADYKEASGDPSATPQPEALYDFEAGYVLRKTAYSFAVNIYSMNYYSQLVPTGELSNVGYPIMTNVEKSFRNGIELSGGIKPFALLSWDLGLTLSRNRIRDFTEYYTDYNTGDWSAVYKRKYLGTVDIAYSPSVTGYSDVRMVLSKNAELHLISKYVGKQYFDNTMSKARMLDAYLVNNLRIDINNVFKKLRNSVFQVYVNNILNTMYESNAYGGNWYEDGVEKTWSYFFPQAGINYMLRFEMLF